MAQPYKVAVDPILGRHLVATQTIKIGTIIIQESPLIRGPFFHTYPICLGCGKILTQDSSHPCKRCGWPVCSEICEKSPNHQPECSLTEARGNQMSVKNFGISNPNYQFVTLLRALHLKRASPEKWCKLVQLQGHPIDLNVAPPAFVKKLFKLDDWTEDEIRRVSENLTVNGHELPLTSPSQLVIYDKASFLEHCCRANCSKTFTNDGEILIVAAEDIPEGTNLSICYTDPFWGVQNRRKHLHQTKNFWCCCERCSDPSEMETHLNSIRCPHRPCQGFLLPKTFLQTTPWICSTCTASFPPENVDFLLAKVGLELSEMPKDDPKPCKLFMNKYDKILTSMHYYMVDVKMALSNLLSENLDDLSNTELSRFLKLNQELKSIAEKLAPAERRFLGLLTYRIAKIKMVRYKRCEQEHSEDLKECQKHLLEAQLLLCNEPTLLPEGRVRLNITFDLQTFTKLSNKK